MTWKHPPRPPQRPRWARPVALAFGVACVIGAVIASPAWPQERHVWTSQGSWATDAWVELQPPTDPRAVAAVTFRNTPVHGADEAFTLRRGDLEVTVTLDWNADGGTEERITVEVPEGYYAHPRTLTVPEDAAATLHIYRMQEEMM